MIRECEGTYSEPPPPPPPLPQQRQARYRGMSLGAGSYLLCAIFHLYLTDSELPDNFSLPSIHVTGPCLFQFSHVVGVRCMAQVDIYLLFSMEH